MVGFQVSRLAAFVAGPLLSLAMLCGSGPAQAGAAEETGDGPLFSLERARREQQRQATSASAYRSDVPWPGWEGTQARPRWLRATVGAEWDEQKTLVSNGLGEPDEIAGKSLEGGTWFVDAGSELFRAGDFAGGLAASYWGDAYEDDRFDTHYPSVAAWLDWAISEPRTVRLRYDVGHARVSGDGYATTHVVGPRLYNDWGENGVTEVRGEAYVWDFHVPLPDYNTEDMPFDGLCVSPPGTPSPDPCHSFDFVDGDRRDRGGWGFVFAGEHRKRFEWNDSEIRGGYHYQHYIPDGAEFHNQSHQLWVEGTTDLPFGFVANANLTFLYQGARNLPSAGEPSELAPNQVYAPRSIRRHDRILRTYLAIARPIVPHVNASLEWYFTEHDSNLEAYDFHSHRIGAYVTAYFP